MNSYKAGISCHTVVTHKRPHDDEIVSLVLLKYYGDKVHPGIRVAIENMSILFWDAGTETPDRRSWQAWHNDGYVLIGVGGSPYDEHALHEDHISKECAATLVAKRLGIQENLELKQLLHLTLRGDTVGNKDPRSMPTTINLGNRVWFDKSEESAKSIVQWAMQPVEWFILDQQSFFNETRKEYEDNVRLREISYKGKRITLASIKSDNERICSYARYTGAHVVITQNSRGHVFIDTDPKANVNLDEVMAALRIKELELRNNIRLNPMDPALRQAKAYPGTELWHYHKPAKKIMNGSLSAPGKEPTKIYFGVIVNIVIYILSSEENIQTSMRKAI